MVSSYVVVVMLACVVPAYMQATCVHWCRTPENQVTCCKDVFDPKPASPVGVINYGSCPPVRPECPPVRSFRPPVTCSSDSDCGQDKCCYDRCLTQFVCKPQYTGGFGQGGFGQGGFGQGGFGQGGFGQGGFGQGGFGR